MRKPLPKIFRRLPLSPPTLVQWPLPWRDWEEEYRNYFRRHYHDARLTFKPSMIVVHYTVTPSAQSTWDGFARGCKMDAGDFGLVWGHSSVQLLVDHDGTVFQLMPLDRKCTGCYGVNHVALSIETVAMNEDDLLSRPRQVWAVIRLVHWLMGRYSIPLSQVHSHFEVSVGTGMVPEYLDYADSKWPHGYPPWFFRFDPGMTTMGWLRAVLRLRG